MLSKTSISSSKYENALIFFGLSLFFYTIKLQIC
jgi:hypothetical protein